MDTQRIRARFPALRREVAGTPVAYFDGPGGTQVPESVVAAVAEQMIAHNGNAGWNYPTSRETDAMIDDARAAFATLFGADDPDTIVFGANMTTLTLRLAHALGRHTEPGDEVVLTELDHHANVDTWRLLEADRGVTIRVARMDPTTGLLDLDHLESLLNERTRLLAIGAASNALGTMPDVARAARAAHDAGALVFVDAVHYASHELPDVAALGADFLAASAYKFYGPHVGVLYGRPDLLAALDLPKVVSASDDAPGRVETGTANFEGIAGALAAVRFLADPEGGDADDASRDAAADAVPVTRDALARTYRALHEHGESLVPRLWQGLNAIDGVTTYGPAPAASPRTPTVGFTIDGIHARDAAGALAERALFVSHGDFYAATVIDRLGVRERGGLLRAGCAIYTTADEVDRLVAAVADL